MSSAQLIPGAASNSPVVLSPAENHAPEIKKIAWQMNLNANQQFDFNSVMEGLFIDPDGDFLDYEVCNADGSLLPDNIAIDFVDGKVLVSADESVTLKIIAYDPEGLSASQDFFINIDATANQITGLGDLIIGTSAVDNIDGLAGNDHILGGVGNDILRGNTGNDILSGGAGSDVYRMEQGDGIDIINTALDAANSAADRLVFGAGITAAQLRFTRLHDGGAQFEDALQIRNAATGDTVLVLDWFDAQRPYAKLAGIGFADGSSLSVAAIEAKANAGPDLSGYNIVPTLPNGEAYGTQGDDYINAPGAIGSYDGNDWLVGGLETYMRADAGNDLLWGGYEAHGSDGDDLLHGGVMMNGSAGNDVLNSFSGSGLAMGYDGDDLLISGGAVNEDTQFWLYGGNGDDTYWVERGANEVLIFADYETPEGPYPFAPLVKVSDGSDRLLFGDGISAEQLWFERTDRPNDGVDNPHDLKITILGSDDEVYIMGWFAENRPFVKLGSIDLQNGQSLSTAGADRLIEAMAQFEPPPAGASAIPEEYMATLAPVLAEVYR